jgi:tetratricopeptide (TPR) repeat protein
VTGTRPLARAERLLRQRKYAEVISLLEPQVFLYRDSFAFYRILGTACLYAGDFGGAHSYFQRAEQIKPRDQRVELGLAAVHLRRKESAPALQRWLSVLERDARNKQAKRGLALVRRTEDSSEYITLAESGKLRRLFPPIGVSVPRWLPIVAGVLVTAVILWYFGVPFISEFLDRQPEREVPAALREPLPENLSTVSAEARYLLSDTEIAELTRSAGQLFNNYRDNMARVVVNRILLSNASQLIKERMRLLASYFREPDFTNFEDNFSYEQIASEPWLYDGVYVRWSGAVTNIDISEDAVRFTLLVGYEDGRVLEGTVPVTATGVVDVQPGNIELIGEISYADEEIALSATSLRRIVPRSDS